MSGYRLDDGTYVEELTVTVGEKEYTGSLTINDVGEGKCAFDVSYGDQYYDDKSLLCCSAMGQMRSLARFELERLVKKQLAKSEEGLA